MPKTTRYANVLAKIGAERGTLISGAKLKTLTENKSLSDIVSQLRETSYQEKLAKASLPLSSRKLERFFQENLIDIYIKTIKNSPKKVKSFLKMYLLKFEVENIKALVKGVYAELSFEEKLAKIYLQVQDFLKNRAVFEEAAKAVNLKQLVSVLKKTEYSFVLSLGYKKYEENGSTMFFDILLDKAFYEKLYEEYQRLPKKEQKHARFYASMEIDSFLIFTILRGKALNYDVEWLKVAIPSNSLNLSQIILDDLVSAPDYGAALKIVLKSHYGRFFVNSGVPEETIANAQKAFRQAVFNYAEEKLVAETFNVGAPLGFMMQKEAETRNLTAISLGIDESMKPEEIERMLLFPS